MEQLSIQLCTVICWKCDDLSIQLMVTYRSTFGHHTLPRKFMALSGKVQTWLVYIILQDSPRLHIVLLPYGCIGAISEGLHDHELTSPNLATHACQVMMYTKWMYASVILYSVSLGHCLYFGLIMRFQTVFLTFFGWGHCGTKWRESHAPCAPSLDPCLAFSCCHCGHWYLHAFSCV